MRSGESGLGNGESIEQGLPRPRLSHSRFPIPESRPRARGFTLVELIAVVVLLAIVMSIVTFSFSKSLESTRVRAASRDLVAALRYTRGQAIVKGEQKVLSLDLENNSYTAPDKSPVRLPENMVLRLTTAAQEQTGESTGGIRFFPDGSSTGGNIAVILGEREWRINVAWLTGEIALEEQDE
jgi:general secretion pathway protein H